MSLWYDPDAAPYDERFKKGVTLDRDHDTTQLKLEQFRHTPHKDYLGHVFRWGFVGRFVNRESRILDVGCGQETPLLLSLGGANRNTVPESYVGVDMNPIPDPPRRKWATILDETNVVEDLDMISTLYGPFNLISCLEVYEHVAPHLAMGFLKALRQFCEDDTVMVFSTPVYSHRFKQARNHINERTKREIEHDLHEAGFMIAAQHGTFGNFQDFKKMLSEEELAAFQEQRDFYGDDVLGCYLAPRFPEASRNITHVCVPDTQSAFADECELKESIVK